MSQPYRRLNQGLIGLNKRRICEQISASFLPSMCRTLSACRYLDLCATSRCGLLPSRSKHDFNVTFSVWGIFDLLLVRANLKCPSFKHCTIIFMCKRMLSFRFVGFGAHCTKKSASCMLLYARSLSLYCLQMFCLKPSRLPANARIGTSRGDEDTHVCQICDLHLAFARLET